MKTLSFLNIQNHAHTDRRAHARMLEYKVGNNQKFVYTICKKRLNCQTCMLLNENYFIQFVGNLFMQKIGMRSLLN